MPETSKLRGLHDKALLRRWAANYLPSSVARRPKQAYGAPNVTPFIGPQAPPYVAELLDPAQIRRRGIFDADAVTGLVRRCRAGGTLGAREGQALVGILSTELWCRTFIDLPAPHSAAATHSWTPMS
jgi:asparagine synthase (glutamine-hydrolysing)